MTTRFSNAGIRILLHLVGLGTILGVGSFSVLRTLCVSRIVVSIGFILNLVIPVAGVEQGHLIISSRHGSKAR